MDDSKRMEGIIKAAVDAAVGKSIHQLRQGLRGLQDARDQIPPDNARSAIAVADGQARSMVDSLVADFEAIIIEHDDFACNRESWAGHAAGCTRGAVGRLFFELNKHFSTHAKLAEPGRTPVSSLVQGAEQDAANALGDYVRGKIAILAGHAPRQIADASPEKRHEKRLVVFYSWEDDLPKKSNRSFIEDCLERALKLLGQKHEIETVLDQDSRETPGTPNITDVIWEKIRKCDVLVGDVSPVARTSKDRGIPNPNVMMELEHAKAEIGWNKILLVFNSAYGNAEMDRPFHLGGPRRIPLTYHLKDEEEPATARSAFVAELTKAMESILLVLLSARA